MALEAVLGPFEPPHVARVAVARHHGKQLGQLGLPLEMLAAFFHALDVHRQGDQREHHIVLGDREVVDHRGVGRLEPDLVQQFALR